MTDDINPFVWGYENFSIRRILMITYDDDGPTATYRSLHPSQTHLIDSQVERFPCVFCNTFVLVTEGQVIPDDLRAQCSSRGFIRSVVYDITASTFDIPVHVGDHCSLESAQEVVRQLTFETGHYNRCWEISTAHLTDRASLYLTERADFNEPTGLMFETFRVPGCCAFGCKLYSTPWTDENLAAIDGSTAAQLREGQLKAGVPESLVDVLHLAATADTRFLIFDPDASELEGLPLFSE